ncbi:phage holin family protein [Natroniella acetigena]|uniref:phage holin family protein n=1 Tax=Natroniella acetigena TaxID=52004 RepID=UPI00200AE6DD|nr:phage holin family protein [Natroniella acetigena]MCK8826419.1 phage holin family protein [Natroniella acetigena]
MAINEEIILRYARLIFSILGTLLTYLLGGWDSTIKILVAFVAMDYISGIIVAFCRNELESGVGRIGILKKVGIFAAVAVSNLVDGILANPDPILRTTTIMFYLGNEGISILENLARAGVDIPEPLRKALAKIKDKETTST